MNAVVKTAYIEALFTQKWLSLRLTKQQFTVALLALAVLISAFSLIYVRDLSRRQFSQLQAMQYVRDDLHIEWGKLLLEQSTWATQARIENVANSQLDMVLPKTGDVVVVR